MKQPDHDEANRYGVTLQPAHDRLSSRRRIFILAVIFFTALSVRLINWYGSRNEVYFVQTNVALNYKHLAGLIRANGLASLYDPAATTSDPGLSGHPPGYPVLLSLIYRVSPASDTAAQLCQIILDALSVVTITLIGFELLPAAVGLIAGILAAFAPQFSWNAMLLLPDTLAALPILLAILLIIRAGKRMGTAASASLLAILGAGALIGVSCWLRANALLLAPFLALLFSFFFKPGTRLRPALVLVAGALLIILPLTIRNAVVFAKFIPISLGAGQTLIEGLADYDTDGSLGLPQTDMELIRGEAETFHRPDYANSLFSPDGVERDRARMARGLAVIRAHPFWFFGVVVRRAASMLRLERTPLRLDAIESGSWQLLFHSPLRMLQKLFITAAFLPLTLLGALILICQRRFQALGILLAVPFYYFCTQSVLHTEYRYVLVIHFFLFVLAAFAIYSVIYQLSRPFRKTAGRAINNVALH